jgi:hypothetical protein
LTSLPPFLFLVKETVNETINAETKGNKNKQRERRDHKGTKVPLLGSPKKLKKGFFTLLKVLLLIKYLK